MIDLDRLDFEKGNGLVTIVTQDARTGAVLMLAHANREALERTLATGEMHYTSRTRGLWHKGATSGNTQRVVALAVDCDRDAILALVEPKGPACHTNTTSCFGQEALTAETLSALDRVIAQRATEPPPANDAKPSYTQRLLADRNLRLKKLGEEAAELITACADQDPDRATEEAADLLYHTLVALRSLNVGLDAIRTTLAQRAHRKS